PAALNLAAVRNMAQEAFGALHVEVRDLAQRPGAAAAGQEGETRAQIEHRILAEAFAADARYMEKAEEWARLAGNLKQMALSGVSPAAMVDALTDGAVALGALTPHAVRKEPADAPA
ncbi:MAG: hypothetical protein M3Y28_09435, partial [Armatimonadota bacterium]|nr:hypothetical protein [Armatimonadota bacterium]